MDTFISREFCKGGQIYTLTLTVPVATSERHLWVTTVSLQQESSIIWIHKIYGIDSIQAIMCGLEFGHTLQKNEGGYTYLDHDELDLP